VRSILLGFGGSIAAVALAACAGSTGSFTPGGSLAGSVRAIPGADYSVRAFSYHIMPLRTERKRAPSAGLRYPDDLTNYGGPMMGSEVSHNIYVNCRTKNQDCWGAPEQFQTKLTGSSFAGLLKQYTGTGPGSFTFGEGTAVTYPVYAGTALYENDLMQILHGVASSLKKTGYANLYHIFLPKGTDTCFDFSRDCYSPDKPAVSDFCAYHAVVRFSDIGVVVYSVEPYQDIKGCLTKKSAGASELTNSTISTLAHETFESITDPGFRLAWYNYVGGEVADECEFFVSSVALGGTVYNTQPMYSNKYHACATRP